MRIIRCDRCYKDIAEPKHLFVVEIDDSSTWGKDKKRYELCVDCKNIVEKTITKNSEVPVDEC